MERSSDPSMAEPAALRSVLGTSGRRLTRQRAAVYAALRESAHHPTAEDVYLAVREGLPSIGLATVYKALEALVASGLAIKLVASAGPARYDARVDHHYHLRCLRSGTVADVPTPFDPDLIAKVDPDLHARLAGRGFRITGYRLELVGYFDEDAAVPTSPPAPADGS